MGYLLAGMRLMALDGVFVLETDYGDFGDFSFHCLSA